MSIWSLDQLEEPCGAEEISSSARGELGSVGLSWLVNLLSPLEHAVHHAFSIILQGGEVGGRAAGGESSFGHTSSPYHRGI